MYQKEHAREEYSNAERAHGNSIAMHITDTLAHNQPPSLGSNVLMRLAFGTNCKRRTFILISFVIDIQPQFLNSLA